MSFGSSVTILPYQSRVEMDYEFEHQIGLADWPAKIAMIDCLDGVGKVATR